MSTFPRSSIALACVLTIAPLTATASETATDSTVAINVDNFNKAQTDLNYAGILKHSGGINKLHHNREPTPIDKQNIIGMNRDTLYSLAVVDISKGATINLPDAGKRYQSLMIINNDGYVNKTFYGAGPHKLTMDGSEIGRLRPM